MKKLFLYFIIFTTFLLNGCFNYKDIDKVLFVTSVIVDIDNNLSPVVYVEAFKPTRGSKGESGKGERILYKGTGKTIFEVVRDLNLSSSYKLNYTQNRGVIFTEKAARECLADFIDFFDRDQELVVRAYLTIFKGDPQKLINAKLKEQEFIGLFIHDLIYNIPASSRGIILRLNDVLNKNYTKSKTAVVTMISMKDDGTSDKIEVSNGAILKNLKMIDSLDRRQALGYNFLTDNIKRGTLEAGNPSANGKYITLEILKSKTKTKVDYNGESIKIKKIITTRTSIGEAQEKFQFTKENVRELEKNAESNIKDACEGIFDDYKGKDLDIFNVSDDFYRKYPKAKINDAFSKSQLEVEVHVHVEGSSDKTDFRYTN